MTNPYSIVTGTGAAETPLSSTSDYFKEEAYEVERIQEHKVVN
jgi:hypothetical protein